MSSTDSKIQKIQTNFQALSAVASSLNAASDEFTRVVGALDEALKKLNIGLTVWVNFAVHSDPGDQSSYDFDQIGYCKVSGKWGIAVRHVWGEEPFFNREEEGPWLFSDAPRDMRLRSVDKIPEVIEALAKEASSTTQKIQEKTKEVRELAEAISPPKAKSPTLAGRIAATTPKARLVDLVRKANAGTVAVPGALPGGESPKAEEGSLVDQLQKGFGKNIEGK